MDRASLSQTWAQTALSRAWDLGSSRWAGLGLNDRELKAQSSLNIK